MPISDLCSKQIVSVERNASLQYAAQLMKKHHVGEVIVTDSNGHKKPIGVVTDRDIVLSVVAENLPLTLGIENIMTRKVASVSETAGVSEVIERMEKEGVRRMLVLDQSGNLCGVVSSDDLLQLLAKEIGGLGNLFARQISNEEKTRPGRFFNT